MQIHEDGLGARSFSSDHVWHEFHLVAARVDVLAQKGPSRRGSAGAGAAASRALPVDQACPYSSCRTASRAAGSHARTPRRRRPHARVARSIFLIVVLILRLLV